MKFVRVGGSVGRGIVGALVLLGAFGPFAATPADAKLMASNYVRSDEFDDWFVWKSADGMCGTEHTDALGTTFSAATVDRAPDLMLIAVSNSSWASMKVGQHYPFTLSMNGVPHQLDGATISGAANDPTFITKLDLKPALDNMSKLRPFSVSLDATPLATNVRIPARAVVWLIECAAGSNDPFRAR